MPSAMMSQRSVKSSADYLGKNCKAEAIVELFGGPEPCLLARESQSGRPRDDDGSLVDDH